MIAFTTNTGLKRCKVSFDFIHSCTGLSSPPWQGCRQSGMATEIRRGKAAWGGQVRRLADTDVLSSMRPRKEVW